MIHINTPSLLAVLLLAVPCAAQEWANKMFTARSYDFGNVARGAKAEYAFELTNLYLEDVHIASVRATCGCTTPRIEKDTLKTYEKGAVIAHINSDRFLGNQGSTITVTIDKPQYAQVQLHVKVHIFSDVLLEPSSVALGGVAQGTSAERTIGVRYTGRSDWQIVEVRSGNPHLSGAVTETSREGGRVTYDLKAVLDKDAPAGYVREYLWLITNDPRTKEIPVPVEGQVQGAVSVSPSSLFLGVVQPGQKVTKQIVVRGQKPFRIVSIHGDCECLQTTFPKDKEAKSLYLVPVTFTAGEKTGRITQVVHIETDSGQTVLEVPAYAVVAGS
jgi:hypothetical protein